MTPSETSATSAPQTSRIPRRYLLWFAAVSLALYLLPFFLIRLPGFESWGGGSFGPMLDFGFRAAGQNADVVIFGDSSALYGLDPLQMSRELGVKVINLPNTLGSLNVTRDLPLERYLKTNTPPRVIVLYIAPYNLDYAQTEDFAHAYEGEEMLLRYGSPQGLLSFGEKHPAELLLVPFRFYRSDPKPAIAAALQHERRSSLIAASMGHAEAAGAHLPGTCRLPAALSEPKSMSSLQALIGKYQSSGASLLSYLAPIPACGNTSMLLDRSYRQIGAAPPKVLPPQSFRADAFYIHPLEEAVPVTTKSLVDAVRPLLADSPAATALSRLPARE